MEREAKTSNFCCPHNINQCWWGNVLVPENTLAQISQPSYPGCLCFVCLRTGVVPSTLIGSLHPWDNTNNHTRTQASERGCRHVCQNGALQSSCSACWKGYWDIACLAMRTLSGEIRGDAFRLFQILGISSHLLSFILSQCLILCIYHSFSGQVLGAAN